MRIAYFTESLLPLVDGVSVTLAHLFDDLEERGEEFRIYAPFAPPPDVAWSYRVRRLPSFRFPLYRDYRVSVPWGRGLARELDAWAPELVHVVSPTPAAMWAQRYAARRGIPIVATFHTHFASYLTYYRIGWLEPFIWWWLRRFYRRALGVFTPSRAMASTLESRGIGPVRIWSRGIDTNRFSPAHRDEGLRAEAGVDPETPMLLMVSRLVREKDLLDLIPMARQLERSGARFRLVLVGDGPLRDELQSALPDAVFAGHQVGRELARWYASGDVFVFPSTTETFGNVVQEALASGLPTVVVDEGGPQSVIEPGSSGLVARANDPVDLAEKVARLLADPALRSEMSLAAREQMEGRSWPRVNQPLLDGYRAVIDHGRLPPQPTGDRA